MLAAPTAARLVANAVWHRDLINSIPIAAKRSGSKWFVHDVTS